MAVSRPWIKVSVTFTAETKADAVIVAAVAAKAYMIRNIKISTNTATNVDVKFGTGLTNWFDGGRFAAGGGSNSHFEEHQEVGDLNQSITYDVGVASTGRVTIWYQEID